jgi:hypothetical protein
MPVTINDSFTTESYDDRSKLAAFNNIGTKMISLSKSKEYAKLASQVPTIYNIQDGKRVLNNDHLMQAGISVDNTL